MTTASEKKAEAASKMVHAATHPVIVALLAKPELSTTEQALLDAIVYGTYNCTPVAYEPATKTRANLPPFSQQPGPDPTYTEWTLQMWPRRSNVDHFEVSVVASNADEALSRALSAYPGHAWEGLTDTGRPVRRLGDSPQA